MHKESNKKEKEKNTFRELINNDESEDPGSELDIMVSDNNKSDNKNITINYLKNDVNEKKNNTVSNKEQTSDNPSKGEELDAFTNNASKNKKIVKTHPQPQAEEIMNPELNSTNDI